MSLPKGMTVGYGDTIMLVGKDEQTYIRTVTVGGKMQTHLGEIHFDALIGVEFGEAIRTHTNHRFFVLAPGLDDIITHLKRETQIIYPKDLGYIALKLSVLNGMQVIEAGSGSGALTTILALMVGEGGQVFSYERRPVALKIARQNIEKLGLNQRVTFHERDITEGFEQRHAHALFLDLPDPENYLHHAWEALRGGGFFGALVPTANQLLILLAALQKGRWYHIHAEELLLRPWRVAADRVRPEDDIVGHSGFLVFARAVYRDLKESLPDPEQLPPTDS